MKWGVERRVAASQMHGRVILVDDRDDTEQWRGRPSNTWYRSMAITTIDSVDTYTDCACTSGPSWHRVLPSGQLCHTSRTWVWLDEIELDFAQLAAPLQQGGKTLNWTDQCEASFQSLRQRMLDRPVVHLPDFSKPFIVKTDASDNGMGAVLQQDHEDQRVVIEYASKTFNKT